MTAPAAGQPEEQVTWKTAVFLQCSALETASCGRAGTLSTVCYRTTPLDPLIGMSGSATPHDFTI
jgi:hypothetical protein